MATFTKFDSRKCKELRNIINKALADAGYDELEFHAGNMKFSDFDVNVKLSVKIKGKKTHAEEVSDELLTHHMKMHGLVKEKNGWTLTGYNSRSYKYPFKARGADGLTYKMSPTQAKIYFAA